MTKIYSYMAFQQSCTEVNLEDERKKISEKYQFLVKFKAVT